MRELGARLGAAPEITGKVPTADLESDNPGVPDETVLGVTYDEIDDFLEGREVERAGREHDHRYHRRTVHKRASDRPDGRQLRTKSVTSRV